MLALAGRRLAFVVAALVVGALAAVACGGSSSESDKREEAVQKFLDRLDNAVRDGDTATRVALLHPAVIDRYGEQQCRDFLASPRLKTPAGATW